MRDMQKNIAAGKTIIDKHARADLRASEIDAIYDLARDKAKSNADIIFYAINYAFYTGVAVGNRQK